MDFEVWLVDDGSTTTIAIDFSTDG